MKSVKIASLSAFKKAFYFFHFLQKLPPQKNTFFKATLNSFAAKISLNLSTMSSSVGKFHLKITKSHQEIACLKAHSSLRSCLITCIFRYVIDADNMFVR